MKQKYQKYEMYSPILSLTNLRSMVITDSKLILDLRGKEDQYNWSQVTEGKIKQKILFKLAYSPSPLYTYRVSFKAGSKSFNFYSSKFKKEERLLGSLRKHGFKMKKQGILNPENAALIIIVGIFGSLARYSSIWK